MSEASTATATASTTKDARLIGGAWRNEDFIFEFDDDGQLKLLSAAGAAKCPYTVDITTTPHLLSYQYHGDGSTMNGYYEVADADSLIILVPSTQPLDPDVTLHKRIPPHQCDRLELKRGSPISGVDEDEFEVKGRDTMKQLREVMDYEEELKARNRPIPILSELITSPINLAVAKPTAINATTPLPPLAPPAVVAVPILAANSNASQTSQSQSLRAPLAVNHSNTNMNDDDLPELIEQTQTLPRPHPNSPIHISTGPTSVASSTPSPHPVPTSPMIPLNAPPQSPVPGSSNNNSQLSFTSPRPIVNVLTHTPLPSSYASAPTPSPPTLPSTPPQQLSSVAAAPTPLPKRASHSSMNASSVNTANTNANKSAPTNHSNANHTDTARPTKSSAALPPSSSSSSTSVTSRGPSGERRRRDARDANMVTWLYGIGATLLAASAIFIGSRVAAQKR